MARIRTIKPEFWLNEDLAQLTEHARLLAIALLNHADDQGHFLANPLLVRSSCFPFEDDSEKVRGSLEELASVGYIEIRECDGKAIGLICKFLDHQRIDKPQKSKLAPAFESASAKNQEKARENTDSANVPGTFAERSQKTHRLEQGKGTGEREQGTGEREQGTVSCSASETEAEPSAIAIVFPCRGTPEEWQLTESQIEEWEAAYPTIDVLAECRKSLAWVKANNLKTAKGMPKFLVSWLGRANDSQGRTSRGSPAPKTFAELKQENTKRVLEEYFNGPTNDAALAGGALCDLRSRANEGAA